MPRRLLTVAAATLGVAVAAASLAPTNGAVGTVTADQPRLGYRIPADGTAGGGWVGSRKLGSVVVYRVDPAKAPSVRTFGRARWVGDFTGSGAVDVGVADTRRASWIVSKYGVYRSKVQGAAVEVALDALLVGGPYAVEGSATQKRLNRSGAKRWILPLVTVMLTASAKKAGPYSVEVSASDAVAGQALSATVTVRSSSGVPIRALPVQIGLDGSSMFAKTGDDGTATVELTAPTPGPRQVQVLVSKLPEHRLLVRGPTQGGGSRVVVAGRKRTALTTAQVAVQARPSVTVTSPATSVVSQPLVASLTLAGGYASPRSSTVVLRGPFQSSAAASCSGTPVAATLAVPVSADAAYQTPATAPGALGYYRWSAQVPADTYNLAATDCGPVVTVKTRPVATVTAADPTLAIGAVARAKVSVGALPPAYAGRAVSRLYGPFPKRSAVTCGASTLVGRRDLAISGPADQGQTTGIKLTQRGFYGWRTTIASAPLSLRVVTPCAATGSVLKVG